MVSVSMVGKMEVGCSECKFDWYDGVRHQQRDTIVRWNEEQVNDDSHMLLAGVDNRERVFCYTNAAIILPLSLPRDAAKSSCSYIRMLWMLNEARLTKFVPWFCMLSFCAVSENVNFYL